MQKWSPGGLTCEVTLREPGELWVSGLGWGVGIAEQRVIGAGEGLLPAAQVPGDDETPNLAYLPPSLSLNGSLSSTHLRSEFSLVLQFLPWGRFGHASLGQAGLCP